MISRKVLAVSSLAVAGVASMHLRSELAFVPVLPRSSGVRNVHSDIPTSQHSHVSTRNNNMLVMMAKNRRRKGSSNNSDIGYIDADRGTKSSEQIAAQQNVINEQTDDTKDKDSPTRTLSGGPSLIFEMARRMLVWDDELYQGLNDASRDDASKTALLSTTLSDNANASIQTPRWRPSPILQRSISNVNPAFRTSSPIMTNAGYAGILRRNSRKKMKPSMWRYCLRVYDKMAELEKIKIDSLDERGRRKSAIRRKTAHHEAALVAASKLALWEEAVKIFRVVEESRAKSVGGLSVARANNTGDGIQAIEKVRRKSAITDNMILSVISACVKGSRVKRTTSLVNTAPAIKNPDSNITSDSTMNGTDLVNTTLLDAGVNNSAAESSPPPFRQLPRGTTRRLTLEERRQPLDAACSILLTMEEKHDIPLVARHVNPIASAYLRLGLRSDAKELINQLKDRDPPPPPVTYKKNKREQFDDEMDDDLADWNKDDVDTEDEVFKAGYEEMQLNIHQVQSKDRGSYALLVKGAVMEEDWVGAVRELQQMTEVGLHPNSRNLNSWAEVVMEKSCRPSGGGLDNQRYSRKSWRKKRDRIWLDNWK